MKPHWPRPRDAFWYGRGLSRSAVLLRQLGVASGSREHGRVLRGKLAPMFIIELLYKAELSEIDAHMADHVAFLNKHYAAGHFVVSGRKIPRDGGIIVATCASRAEVEAIIAEDPFVARGLAEFRIIEFRASQRAPDFPKRLV